VYPNDSSHSGQILLAGSAHVAGAGENVECDHFAVSQPVIARRAEPALLQELRHSDPHTISILTQSDPRGDIPFRAGCGRAVVLPAAFAFGRLYFFCRLLSFFLQALWRNRRATLTDQADDVAVMPHDDDRIGFVRADMFNHLATLIELA